MEKRPTKCPLCGSNISKVMNATTKNFYYKCSNHKCRFVLGSNYTDAEYYLQGQTLKTGCIKCGESLTVVNGPNGLYARCFHCDCDTRPIFYNGKMYQKWVNANRKNVKEEVNTLINSFKSSENSEDAQYDFDAYIASPVEEVPMGNLEQKDTICTKILATLRENKDKPMGATELGILTKTKINSVRTSLLSLRSLGSVKIVNFRENPTGNHTLFYQSVDSSLPEIKTYTKEDGYNTVGSFLKENAKKYGSIVRAKEILIKGLKDNAVEPVLFHSSRGICSGYPISAMEKIMDKQPIQTSLNFEEEIPQVTKSVVSRGSRDESKAKIMGIFQEDTTIPYTMAQIAKKIQANKCYTKALIKELRKSKKIKVVGWDRRAGQPGAVALKYQVTESTLPKFKTTVDNNLYVTLKQFYKKKLSGKRTTSISKAEKAVSHLPVIPLIINQRAYVGYAMADLKEIFKDCLDPSLVSTKKVKKVKRIKKIKRAKEKETFKNIDVETAVVLSQVAKEAQSRVSNPMPKRKSIFSSLTSLFKKEKVRS